MVMALYLKGCEPVAKQQLIRPAPLAEMSTQVHMLAPLLVLMFHVHSMSCTQALVSEYKSLGNQKEAAAQAAASKLEAELKKAQVGQK
jgi:hypothetical protein